MTSFAERCGLHDAAREAACAGVLQQVREQAIELVRVSWCDLHGTLRSKTLVASALADALSGGIGMVSTLLLKDSSDRTAFQVFEPGLEAQLPGFAFANNVTLLPDPASFQVLPWAPGTGWLQAQPWFADANPVPNDTRRVLQGTLARLAQAGYGLRCGLEVEFHVYRLEDPRLDAAQAAWPAEPPRVSMVHPGYQLLSEGYGDLADAVLRTVQHTAQGLKLPLRSLEVEFGPSQFEAVFDPLDALAAADAMVLFRSGVRQALRRAGYHASFVCRPPFPNVMASGWHLHQSLVDRASRRNLFCRDAPAPGSTPADAQHTLSAAGEHYLAGLLEHAVGMTAFCTPTVNGFGRFKPGALAPQAVLWGRDNRGAMLRVVGAAGDAATHIENRLGEPAANPYLYLAANAVAGLDGLQRRLAAPRATDEPYGSTARLLPTSLGAALDAFESDPVMAGAWGPAFATSFVRLKRAEQARHDAAPDKAEWDRREYFGRL